MENKPASPAPRISDPPNIPSRIFAWVVSRFRSRGGTPAPVQAPAKPAAHRGIEPLEQRIAPAVLILPIDPTLAQDIDEDDATESR